MDRGEEEGVWAVFGLIKCLNGVTQSLGIVVSRSTINLGLAITALRVREHSCYTIVIIQRKGIHTLNYLTRGYDQLVLGER